MLLKYDARRDGPDYLTWARARQAEGFVFPLSELMETLEVSRQFVQQQLEPELDYAYYDKGTGPIEGERSFLYFRQKDIAEWVKRRATFTRQMVLVDLVDFCGGEALSKVEIVWPADAEYPFARGFVPYDILREVGAPVEKIEYPSQAKRKEYPAYPVPPVDIFSDEGELFHPKNAENTETAYRKAFLEGMVKISLSPRKTIFWKPKRELCLPWLIPYDVALRLEKEYSCDFGLPKLADEQLQGLESNWGKSRRPYSSQYSIERMADLRAAASSPRILYSGVGGSSGSLGSYRRKNYLFGTVDSLKEAWEDKEYLEQRRWLAELFISRQIDINNLNVFLRIVRDEYKLMRQDLEKEWQENPPDFKALEEWLESSKSTTK